MELEDDLSQIRGQLEGLLASRVPGQGRLFETVLPLWQGLAGHPLDRRPCLMISFLKELGRFIPRFMVQDGATGSPQKYADVFLRDVANITRRVKPLSGIVSVRELDKFFYDKMLKGEGHGVL